MGRGLEESIVALNSRSFGREDPFSDVKKVRKLDAIVELSEEGELMGYLIYKECKHYFLGKRSAVAKKFRRRGIGQKMYNLLVAKARQAGKPYKTYASIANLASINAHIKAGMVVKSIGEEWIWLTT